VIGMIDRMLKEKAAHTPTTGFTVVGVDGFAIPGDGESLYTITHCETAEEAEEIAARHRTADGDKIYVYCPAPAQ